MERKTPCGEEEDMREYTRKDSRPYCLQLAHLLRSIHWYPAHLKSKKVKEVLKVPPKK